MMKRSLANKQFNEKYRFLFYGLINFLITNLILQLMLLIFQTYIATLISQITNLIIGFNLYGKRVFKVKSYTPRSGTYYLILASVVWLINWSSINYISNFGYSKNFAAILMIPILVLISFYGQKKFVFNQQSKKGKGN